MFNLHIVRYKKMDKRSKKSIFNIILSFVAKGISIITSLMVVPLTIHYINPTQYGIWLSLSSIIAWIGFFDLGLGNGMRNKFAEAKAQDNIDLAKQYVSTTYFTITCIVILLFTFVSIINLFIDWTNILNIESSYKDELRSVFGVLSCFFCLNMVVKLFSTILTADQNPGLSSLLHVTGQVLSLFAIFILTKYTEGSLLNLAIFYAGIPTFTLLFASFYAFRFTRYKLYTPHLKSVRPKLIKNTLNLGLQFFIIYLCMILIFQIVNIAISREIGPTAVTEYNVAYRYFNIVHSIAIIIISPFWSAFTDAYHKNDINWMRRVKTALEKLWLLLVLLVFIMVFIADYFYSFWIGDDVTIAFSLSIGMAVFILSQTLGAIYMQMINGIGSIRLQLIIYVSFALISYPLMIYSCQKMGLLGVIIMPTLCYFIQAIVSKIQLEKILSGKGVGIWIR